MVFGPTSKPVYTASQASECPLIRHHQSMFEGFADPFGTAGKGCAGLIRHSAKDTLIPRHCMYTSRSQTLAMYAAAVPRGARSCTKFLCFLGERYRSGLCVTPDRSMPTHTIRLSVNDFLSRNQTAGSAESLAISTGKHTLRYVTLRSVTLRYETLRYVTSCYVTLRYVTLLQVTLC